MLRKDVLRKTLAKKWASADLLAIDFPEGNYHLWLVSEAFGGIICPADKTLLSAEDEHDQD